jgi:hypothetical protein
MRNVTRGGRPGTAVLGTLRLLTTGCGALALARPYSLPPDSGADGAWAPPSLPAWADEAKDSIAMLVAASVSGLQAAIMRLTSARARLTPNRA